MLRLPVKSSRPLCYGISHAPNDAECVACPHQANCIQECGHWGSYPSVSQALQQAEQALVLPFDITELCQRIYVRVFGKKCYSINGEKFQAKLFEAQLFCDRNKLDVATYLEAQMEGMRWWLTNTAVGRRAGFQANHLVGGKSAARYDEFIRKTNRLQNHAKHHSTDGNAAYKDMRRELVESEIEFGRMALSMAEAGEELSVAGIAKNAFSTSPRLWSTVFTESLLFDAERRKLYENYSEVFLRGLGRVCRLAALSEILNWIRSELPDQLHVRTPVDWCAVAPALLPYLPELAELLPLDADISELIWSPG